MRKTAWIVLPLLACSVAAAQAALAPSVVSPRPQAGTTPIAASEQHTIRPARGDATTPFADAMTDKCFTRSDIPRALAPKYDDLVRRIHLDIWRPENEFRPGDTVRTIAQKIEAVAMRADLYAGTGDKVSRDLIRAEAIVAWVRSNVEIWPELNSKPGKERVEWNRPERVLSHSPRPKCNCDGFGRLTNALAKELNVEELGVGGAKKDGLGRVGYGASTRFIHGTPWNHGWNMFLIGGKYLPADSTTAWKFFDPKLRAGWGGKVDAAHALPMARDEWDFYLGFYRVLRLGNSEVESDPLTTMTRDEWLTADVQHLAKRRTLLRVREEQRNDTLQQRQR